MQYWVAEKLQELCFVLKQKTVKNQTKYLQPIGFEEYILRNSNNANCINLIRSMKTAPVTYLIFEMSIGVYIPLNIAEFPLCWE